MKTGQLFYQAVLVNVPVVQNLTTVTSTHSLRGSIQIICPAFRKSLFLRKTVVNHVMISMSNNASAILSRRYTVDLLYCRYTVDLVYCRSLTIILDARTHIHHIYMQRATDKYLD